MTRASALRITATLALIACGAQAAPIIQSDTFPVSSVADADFGDGMGMSGMYGGIDGSIGGIGGGDLSLFDGGSGLFGEGSGLYGGSGLGGGLYGGATLGGGDWMYGSDDSIFGSNYGGLTYGQDSMIRRSDLEAAGFEGFGDTPMGGATDPNVQGPAVPTGE
ncbi:hypothetical protein BGZ47_003354, partial [Haplosporangium gracile]